MPAHFSEASLKFLRGLERHNDRNWFNDRKDLYEAELKAPLLEVIAAISAGLPDEFVREPNKIAMRIYRDIRFSTDKRPYKTNLAAWWARRGMEKTSGGGFYFELNTKHITVAAGVYMPGKDQLLAIRRMLLTKHEAIRKAMNVKGLTPFEGLKLTRPPKGFAPDTPGLDLILQRQWGISAKLPIEAALKPTLAKQVIARFHAAAPLVALLNEPFAETPAKPIF